MMRIPLSTAIMAAVLFLPSAAAALCGERAALVAALRREWQETPRFRGLAADGRLMELLLSPAGSWSVLAVLPDGTACLVGAGEAGTLVVPAPAPGESS